MTLTATDGGSGVKVTYYKVDAERLTTYTAPFTISGDGLHTFHYWSVDNANNTETVNPRTSSASTPSRRSTTSSFNPATNANYNATQTVTLTASDTGGSGVRPHLLQGRRGAVTTYTTPFTISGDTTHTFSYYSVDNANNKETRTPRTCSASTHTAGDRVQRGLSYSGTVTITLTPTDISGSGVAYTYYKVDPGATDDGHGHHGQPAGIRHRHAHDPVLVGGQRHQQGDDRERDCSRSRPSTSRRRRPCRASTRRRTPTTTPPSRSR